MKTVHSTNTQPRTGFGLLDVPDPPPLPEGSLFERFILESPVAVIAIVLVATLIVWLKFRQVASGGRTTMLAGAGIATAVLIATVATLVETRSERLQKITTTLVADAIHARAESVAVVLHDDCVLIEPFSRDEMDRDRILRGIRDRIPTFGISDHAALEVSAYAPNERFGKVQVKVRVNISGAGVHFSWWELEYERTAGGDWRVIRIKPLSMSGRDAF
jgi:hypothetical protein